MTPAIKDLLTVIGPVLVLISFFTTQRAGEIRALVQSKSAKPADFLREALISTVLPLFSLALLVVCLGQLDDAVKVNFGKGNATSITWALSFVCLLLVCLAALQAHDARRAWKLWKNSRVGAPKRAPKPVRS